MIPSCPACPPIFRFLYNSNIPFQMDYPTLQLLCILQIIMSINFSRMKNERQEEGEMGQGRVREVMGYWPERFALPPGYSMLPTQQQLFTEGGRCKQLTIRNVFGSLTWKGAIDLSSLQQSLAQTVHIADQQVEVYLNDCGKPPLNYELNRPCHATFITRIPIKLSNLLASCRLNGTQLVSHSSQRGEYTVAIPHFTRYVFNSINDESRMSSSKLPNRSQRSRSQRNINDRGSDILNGGSRVVEYEVPRRAVNMKPTRNDQQDKVGMMEEGRTDNKLLQQLTEEDPGEAALRGLARFIVSATAIDEIDQGEYDFQNVTREKLVEIDNINKAKMKYTVNNRDVPVLSGCMYAARGSVTRISNLFSTTQKIDIQPTNKAEEAKPDISLRHFQALLQEKVEITAESIREIVVSEEYAPEVRRILSLYAILFEKELQFDIVKDQNTSSGSNRSDYKIVISYAAPAISELKRREMIKNWLAWVIQDKYTSKDIESFFQYRKSIIISPLAMRRPETVINQLFINNRFEDAEILVNLQCKQYKKCLSNYKMDACAEIQSVLSQKFEELRCSNWLVSLALASWYFFEDSFTDNLKKIVDLTTHANIPFGIQMRMFQLYLFKLNANSQKSLFVPLLPTSSQLICHWFMSNRLSEIHKLQQEYYQSLPSRFNVYSIYRNKLIEKMTSILSKQERHLLVGMIEQDNYISKDEKQIFYADVIDEDVGFLQGTAGLEKEADLLIENSNYFEALEILVGIPEWSRSITEKIIKMVTLPQMLFNYKKHISARLSKLLKNQQKDFWDILIILDLPQDVPFNSKQLIRLLQILQGQSRFSPFITEKGRNFILHFLQKRILQALILKKPLWKELISNVNLMEEVKKAIKSKVSTLNKIEQVICSQAFLRSNDRNSRFV